MASSSSPSPPLPSDIIFKILTRTSLKTIDTCKVVDKEWHDMTFESSFMPQFCASSQNISGYFFQCLSFGEYVSEFASMDGCSGNSTTTPFHLPIDEQVKKPQHSPFEMKILASSMQGILCCERMVSRDRRYHICKPSTNQWVKLPNPRTRYRTEKVALIVLRSNPLHFRIIRLSSPWILYHHYMKQRLDYFRREIFDSEHWEWRQGNDLLFPSQTIYFDQVAPAVHASGLIYFKLSGRRVMALNYDGEEVFPRFSLPNPGSGFDEYKYLSKNLFEYKGKLGFNCSSPKRMKLWVFDNGKRDWELRMEVDFEAVQGMPKLRGFYNADIALMVDDSRVIFYKLKDKSFNKVKLKKCWSYGKQEIFPFRSDLEPFDLRMPGANIVSSSKHLYRPSWIVSSSKHLYRPSWISMVIVFIFLFCIWLFSHA